jgi:rhomboid protease GluP
MALIAINIILYGVDAFTNHALAQKYEMLPSAVQHGEWWRFVTYGFMHGSWPHVLINMYALLQAGAFVEYCYGTPRYAIIYAFGLVGGGIAAYLTTISSDVPTVGASGAILGVFGAMVILAFKLPRLRSELLRAGILPILLTLGYGLFNPNVSNWGHIGGLLLGGLAAVLLTPVRGRELAPIDQDES